MKIPRKLLIALGSSVVLAGAIAPARASHCMMMPDAPDCSSSSSEDMYAGSYGADSSSSGGPSGDIDDDTIAGSPPSSDPSVVSSGGGYLPAIAGVPALSAGIEAPTFDVGTDVVSKGTLTYSNSIGSSDSFSVGSMTNIGTSVSASSTPDYSVSANATFGLSSSSSINQSIGSLPSTSEGTGSFDTVSTISGSFNKSYTADSIDSNVTVNGIGTNASIEAGSSTAFTANVEKASVTSIGGDLINTGAGSANGSANGVVSTNSTANANSSQFVSSFAQAY